MKRPRKYDDNDPMVIACRDAIERAGGHKKLAASINRTWQAVYAWEIVPVSHVLAVARMSKTSVHILRPDLYGDAPKALRRISV